MAFAAMLAWAQAPQSGTYKIKSAGGTYVQIKGKYYAKPDAQAAGASTVGIGVGYKDGDNGYRVYSLSGTNPVDQSTIEIFNYVDKACNIVSKFAQAEIDKKLGTGKDKGAKQQALDAMADSICRIYTDDYAYMTIVPVAHYGKYWKVRAKAAVPAIPYTVQAAGNYLVVGNEVIKGHKCTDVWDWAKQHVLKYIYDDTKQTDQRLRDMVEKYLDSITPGTTYYLRYDPADHSFGYETTPSDNGIWTLETVEAKPDGLTPGTFNIQNQSTTYYVNVKGKYDAEPELTKEQILSSDALRQNAAVNVEFGRYNRNDANIYRITELSNQGRDIVAYIYKGMQKANEMVDKKLQEKDAYTKMADMINSMIDSKNETNKQNGIETAIPHITAAQIRADVKTAFDLCAEHYAYMKLIDNGDNTVSLRVDVPKVPAALDLAIQMYKGDDNAKFIDFAKEQITSYFERTDLETDANLKKLWNQNRDKWTDGNSYYLSAESQYKTFEFTTEPDATTKWLLADLSGEDSEGNPFKGYFRIKNTGNGRYVTVKGRASADLTTTAADRYVKPGTVIYINTNASPVKLSAPQGTGKTVSAFEILNLRGQGIDIMNGVEEPIDVPSGDQSPLVLMQNKLSNLQDVYGGYMSFMRYTMGVVTSFFDKHLRLHVWDTRNEDDKSELTEPKRKLFDQVMNDFNTNYLSELKMPVYLVPVEGEANTYRCRSMAPSMKPVSDFYNANKAAVDTIVIPATRYFFKDHKDILDAAGFSYETMTQTDDDLITSWYTADGDERGYNFKDLCEKKADGTLKGSGTTADPWTLTYSTILSNDRYIFDWLKLQFYKLTQRLQLMGMNVPGASYVEKMKYNTPYYLFAGTPREESSDKTKLGFGKDTYLSLSDGKEETTGYDKWTLEPVDETNYFTVKPIGHKAKNDMYYASVYLDFPFEVKGENVGGVYTLDADKGVTEADGATYVNMTRLNGGVVPAATPAFIEFKQADVDSTLALMPVVGGARNTTQNALIQGTFLGGKHNVTDSGDALTQLVAYNGSIDDKFGTTAEGKDLYLFGYDKTAGVPNPYGFYLFSSKDDTEKIIPANKPFLLFNATSAQSRIYFVFNGEPTGINTLQPDTDSTIPADAPRYNLKGQRVSNSYKGIVVVKGHKYINK